VAEIELPAEVDRELRARMFNAVNPALNGFFVPLSRRKAVAEALYALVRSELDRLRSEADAAEQALINQPALRHCVYPGCLREFDAMATMEGKPPSRPSWSGEGWLQVNVLNGHICPDHAHVVSADAHRPRRLASGRFLVCACGWESTPMRWRGYGTEQWKDHVLTTYEPIEENLS
jgi:hypothetical protein